jgi:sulfonate transport system substrate-binding protein
VQRDAIGRSQFVFWQARSGFIAKNRAAMVDFMEDSVRVVRWYLDPRNHDEAVQIAAKITKLRPELFAGWLFTNKEYSRSPDLLPDLAALQANIDVQRDLGFLKGPIDVQKYTDLSIVREAAQRLK